MRKAEITTLFSNPANLESTYLVADPYGIKHNPVKHANEAKLMEAHLDLPTPQVTVQFTSGETKRVPINMVRSTWADWQGKSEEAMKVRTEADAKVQAEIQGRRDEMEKVLADLALAGLEVQLNPAATSVTMTLEQVKALHEGMFPATADAEQDAPDSE